MSMIAHSVLRSLCCPIATHPQRLKIYWGENDVCGGIDYVVREFCMDSVALHLHWRYVALSRRIQVLLLFNALADHYCSAIRGVRARWTGNSIGFGGSPCMYVVVWPQTSSRKYATYCALFSCSMPMRGYPQILLKRNDGCCLVSSNRLHR